jgi:hypothetical protein
MVHPAHEQPEMVHRTTAVHSSTSLGATGVKPYQEGVGRCYFCSLLAPTNTGTVIA